MKELWTIGHSTRSEDELVSVLADFAIECVVDVRRFPGSRRHPHFSQESLARTLPCQGVEYAWVQELGGRRRIQFPDAPSAWRNPSFKAYGQHVASEEFAQGLQLLLHTATACRTAIMCSELLWWRCHRALISDVVQSLGWTVTHIFDRGESRRHAYTAPARIVCGCLTYEV
jgi:uncharacterized protein (DUF488 family)